jgi:spore coat polysaccharide biosynthesis protein SpsF
MSGPETPDLRVGAVVHARMSSNRLPGKVLRPLAGRLLLGWVVDRLAKASELSAVVVATSEESDDDPVAEFCRSEGVPCHRGPLDDVAGRVVGAAAANDLDVLVRISGDSPLIHPAVVDLGVARYRAGDADLVTNVFPRTFPPGQSVEVVATDLLRSWLGRMTTPSAREHVTISLYEAADELRIVNLVHPVDLSAVRMTVDTEEEALVAERVLAGLGSAHLGVGLDDLADLVVRASTSRPAGGGSPSAGWMPGGTHGRP